MQAGELPRLLAVFVAVFVVVLSVGVLVNGNFASQPAAEEPTSPGAFAPEQNLASEPVETGSVEVDGVASPQTILIDAAHRNTQVRDRTQVLSDVLTRRGHEVRYYSPENKIGQFEDRLSDVDAIVIVAPTQQYTTAERTALNNFTDDGGRIVVLAEPKQTTVNLFGAATTRVRTESVLTRYGISPGAGYLYDLNSTEAHFQTITVAPASNNSLVDDVDNVTFSTSTSLTVSAQATPLLETSSTTNSSTLRTNASYTVAARHSNVVVLGDSEFLTKQNYRKANNEKLVANLVEFLIGID